MRSGPKSGDMGRRGLAAHVKQRFGSGPRSMTAPKSTLHAERIEEEPSESSAAMEEVRERDDSAEEREDDGPTKAPPPQ